MLSNFEVLRMLTFAVFSWITLLKPQCSSLVSSCLSWYCCFLIRFLFCCFQSCRSCCPNFRCGYLGWGCLRECRRCNTWSGGCGCGCGWAWGRVTWACQFTNTSFTPFIYSQNKQNYEKSKLDSITDLQYVRWTALQFVLEIIFGSFSVHSHC